MDRPSGLILAGGEGRRMGGRDKGLVEFHGRPLIDWVVERVRPQVGELFISANRNLGEYGRRGAPVLADTLPGFQGPLAGMLSGLEAARGAWLLVVPCDVPHLPVDLARRLMAAAGEAQALFAEDDARAHPAIALVNRNCLLPLRDYLAAGGRSVNGFLTAVDARAVHFPNPDAFRNLNEATQLD
jgi:molybdopterin-guanine dinucleotide biosynthesis protein A